MLGGWFVGLIFVNGRHPAMLALRERTVPKKSSPKKCTFAIVDYKRKNHDYCKEENCYSRCLW